MGIPGETRKKLSLVGRKKRKLNPQKARWMQSKKLENFAKGIIESVVDKITEENIKEIIASELSSDDDHTVTKPYGTIDYDNPVPSASSSDALLQMKRNEPCSVEASTMSTRRSGNRCQYLNCGLTPRNYKNLKMYRFPFNNTERSRKWIINCGNVELATLSPTSLRRKFLCQFHFTEEDFSMAGRLIGSAVPQHHDSRKFASSSIDFESIVSEIKEEHIDVLFKDVPHFTYKPAKKPSPLPDEPSDEKVYLTIPLHKQENEIEHKLLESIKPEVSEMSNTAEIDNEFVSFGNSIVCQLQKLPEHLALESMAYMQSYLVKQRLKANDSLRENASEYCSEHVQGASRSSSPIDIKVEVTYDEEVN